jgi:hypothetical protein
VAGHTRPSVNKRLREAQKKEKQAAKAERRAQRAEERKQRGPAAGGEDPDIAGIVPGPQPLPWGEDEPNEASSLATAPQRPVCLPAAASRVPRLRPPHGMTHLGNKKKGQSAAGRGAVARDDPGRRRHR